MNSLVLAYILIVLGVLLMGAELLLPAGGVAFVLGVAAVVVGIAMTFATDTGQGLLTLTVIAMAVPVLGGILLHYWPKTPMGKSMVLGAADDDATVANMPVNLELEQLRGRYGRTVSALRPAGTVDFDGRRVDTLSEGPMIDPGTWVRCIDVRAGRVVVRQVERPPDLADLDPDDLRG